MSNMRINVIAFCGFSILDDILEAKKRQTRLQWWQLNFEHLQSSTNPVSFYFQYWDKIQLLKKLMVVEGLNAHNLVVSILCVWKIQHYIQNNNMITKEEWRNKKKSQILLLTEQIRRKDSTLSNPFTGSRFTLNPVQGLIAICRHLYENPFHYVLPCTLTSC